MQEITRITTQYVEDEDRIRLCGETAEAETTVLWLPQRLLNRLIPALCQKLGPGPHSDRKAEALNAFEQMAAVQSLAPLPVVKPAAHASSHTIRVVTIVPGAVAIRLLLKNNEASDCAAVSMTLRHEELRQWLAILHNQYVKAGWPTEIWPEWLRAPTRGISAELVMH